LGTKKQNIDEKTKSQTTGVKWCGHLRGGWGGRAETGGSQTEGKDAGGGETNGVDFVG